MPIYFGKLTESLWEGRINTLNDPMYMMLCNNLYAPSQDGHKFFGDVTNEIAGTGYFPGGQPVTGLRAAYTGSTKQLLLTGGNVIWPTAIFTGNNAPAFGVFYMQQSNAISPSQYPLVGYLDFGGTIVANNQAFYINWQPANTVLSMTVPT
jgi:hypothetical protein